MGETASTDSQNLTIIDTQPSPLADAVSKVTYRSAVDHADDWMLVEAPAAAVDWVVVLHGHGSTGDQLYTRPDIRDTWLPLLRELNLGIVSPNLRGNAWMGPAAVADLRSIIRWVKQQGAQRVLLLGGSMGGTGVLIYTSLHPEDVAAVVSLCPATDLSDYYAYASSKAPSSPTIAEIVAALDAAYAGPPASRKPHYDAHSTRLNAHALTMPIFIAHGDDDQTIPVDQARKLIEHLPAQCVHQYIELPAGNHDAPLPLAVQGLRWVLSQLD